LLARLCDEAIEAKVLSGQAPSDVKRADLALAVGAPVVGLGLGLGGAVHGCGMLDKQRLEERAGVALSRWSKKLYRLCWIATAIGGLVAVVYALDRGQ
jgi:hypothetical protein